MADRPFATPLPADLPEDWTSGQIVAPAGADVGLSQQHGYNYLMEQVNAAQRALNAVNESFDTISGKRICRVTVGTSTAGWTQADCDYLCDGTNDQTKIEAAVVAVYAAGGGEIAILAGQYNLPNGFIVDIGEVGVGLAFTGEPGATVLNLGYSINSLRLYESQYSVSFFGITFRHDNHAVNNEASLNISGMSAVIENCIFHDVGVYWNAMLSTPEDNKCRFVFHGNTVEFKSVVQTPLHVRAYSGGNTAVVSGNTFLVKWDQQSTPGYEAVHMNISGSFEGSGYGEKVGAVFTGNTVICDQESAGLRVRVEPAGIISNNIFVRTSIYALVQTVCTGNYLEGGRIIATGYGQITGNMVAAPASLPAINVMKDALTPVPQAGQTPNITGNTIVSGSIGVHLDESENPNADPSQSKALVACNRITGCTTSIQIESNWSGCLITGNMIDTSVVNLGTGNLVRLNSDDTGSGGGGAAGVASFNGRSGTVVPMTGDYTASMVGARPDTWTPTAADVGAIPSGAVQSIQAMTQEQYDALTQKDAATLYLIKE